MFGFESHDMGIDLGTASILVYIKGKGVVLKEPSVVAIDRDTDKVMAIGEDARLMIGRTPGNIVAVRPLRQGVISDYTVTEKMIKYFINKAIGKKTFRKPRIAVCIPSGATEVEKKAVIDAATQAGARRVYLIEEPIAAAIGAGIDISKASGNMAVDINDIAIEYLKENAAKNKLKEGAEIIAICGDTRIVAEEELKNQKFDRLIMNLPGLAPEFLDVAIEHVKDGGIINYYEFSDGFSKGIAKIQNEAKKQHKTVEILNTRKVTRSNGHKSSRVFVRAKQCRIHNKVG